MARPGPCFSTSPVHQLQQPSSSPCSSLAQPLRAASSPCHVLEMGIGHFRSPSQRLFRGWSAFRKSSTMPSTSARCGLLVLAAAGQEAATSTLVLQEVEFAWRGEGSEVLLSGDFLGWAKMLTLVKGADGVFLAKQKLPLGNYQYKYIIDGEWLHSPDCPTVPDGVGGFNNQIIVTDYLSSSLSTPGCKPSLEETSSNDAVNGPKPSEIAGSAGMGLKDAASPPSDTISKESVNSAVSEASMKAGKNTTSTLKAAPAGKVAAAKPAKKVAQKPLPQLMSEDVIPALKMRLGKEDAISNLDILFDDNQLEGSFSKSEVIYSFWAYFPDGKLEGSRGFSLSSHGAPPSTIEPFLIDEKKISAELVVFWITKRLFAQKLLSVN